MGSVTGNYTTLLKTIDATFAPITHTAILHFWELSSAYHREAEPVEAYFPP